MQKNSLKSLSILFFSLVATLLLIRNSSAIDELEWPYEILTDKGEITVYQPQLESFTDDKISSRAAVSVQKKGEEEPVFGAMWMDARVSTDRNTRQVKFLGVKVTNVKFPDATPEQIAELKQIIESHVPEEEIYISLDHLLTMLELVEKEKAVAGNLNTDPPKIIFVTHPAMLVSIDGEPKLQKIENTQIMRVINTPFIILFDTKSKTYYLQTGRDWMKADDVMGPWAFEPKPPSMIIITAARLSEPDTGDDDTSTSADLKKPELIVTKEPTELIVSEGEPAYSPIKGTNLLYMSSTDSDVFMEIDSQKYFVLLSGRWYSSTSLNGPWNYVAADSLPADFAMIPEGSAKARVLANVAGTTEAKEAVLDAQIPQTAAIDRNDAADFTVDYDGEPQFEPIETTEMYYATNTGYSVIRVGNMYYLCDEAVWYESGSPNGPWIVSISVPQVIYTMPPSSPVYHVRYVYVYDHTPEVVYVGYYPGYVGTYIYGPTIIYGTGWYYRPWYRHRYYPRPYTWGVAVRYNHYTGGWGVRVGYGGPVGWYGYGRVGWVGGGRGYHRGYRDIHYERTITTRRGKITKEVDIERRYGDIDIDRNISFEPNENFYDKRKEKRESRETRRDGSPRTPEDRRARDSDRRRDERPGIPEDRQRDRIDREQAPSRLDRDKTRKRAETGKSQTGTTRKSRYDNLYADRDGNVYRKTNQGWEKHDRSGWSRTQPAQQPSRQQSTRQRTSTRQPAAQPSTRQQTTSRQQTTTRQTQQQISRQKTQKRQMSYDRQQADLNRHYQARERGTQRTRNYQQAKSHSRSRSGGASRGARGGGRRR